MMDPRPCQFCNKVYKPKSRQASRYCSISCKKRARYLRLRQRQSKLIYPLRERELARKLPSAPRLEHQTNCFYCDQLYIPKVYWQRTCSPHCGDTFRNRRKQRALDAIPRKVFYCKRCAADLSDMRRDAIYCSRTCNSMDSNFKRRGQTQFIGITRRKDIYDRDKGRCYLCNKHLTLKEMHLDHIIPIRKGGGSEMTNLAVSCPTCNRSKGIKVGSIHFMKLAELKNAYN